MLQPSFAASASVDSHRSLCEVAQKLKQRGKSQPPVMRDIVAHPELSTPAFLSSSPRVVHFEMILDGAWPTIRFDSGCGVSSGPHDASDLRCGDRQGSDLIAHRPSTVGRQLAWLDLHQSRPHFASTPSHVREIETISAVARCQNAKSITSMER